MGFATNKCAIALLGLLAFTGIQSPSASAQTGSRAVPREDYLATLVPYYDGRYDTAIRSFRSAAKGGIRSSEGRWVDSICYHAMIGECYYQMGDLARSLEQHTAALQLALAHRDWMLRVEFPPALQQSQRAMRAMPWGQSASRGLLARFPDTMLSFQGRMDNSQVVKQGGVVTPAQYYPLRVTEIVRCTAVSLRRRRQLLGPAGKYDPLTAELQAAFARRPAPPQHWSQAWVECFLGLATSAAGQLPQASQSLANSVLAGGQFYHPLTAIALLELGDIEFQKENYQAATVFYMDATFVAAAFSQYDIMVEAFDAANSIHIITAQKGPFAPLAGAAAWAKRESGSLEASLYIIAAESLAEQENATATAAMLDSARRAMLRKDLANGRMGARYQFVSSLASFRKGDVASGRKSFDTALAMTRVNSMRLFHIGVADRLFGTGAVTERVGDMLFAEVLREPTPRDWVANPAEALAVSTTPYPLPLEHWLEIAISRKESEKAIAIADQIRRQRFHSTLPMGGRLLALRWIMESNAEELSATARLQRQDLELKYPNYTPLRDAARESLATLRGLPVVSDDPDVRNQQKDLYKKQVQSSTAQEVLLRQMALGRNSTDVMFPPVLTMEDLQSKLPEKTVVLSFLQTTKGILGFAIGKESYSEWQIKSPTNLRRDLSDFLKLIGNRDADQPIPAVDLANEEWKSLAAKLLAGIMNNTPEEQWSAYEEVVVVPDSWLWYVPFEALPASEATLDTPLGSQLKFRFAPTTSLAVPRGSQRNRNARTLIVGDQLYGSEDADWRSDSTSQLADALGDTVRLKDKLPVPSSLLAPQFDRLIVLEDQVGKIASPYDWAPMQLDHGKSRSSLASWLSLPWGASQELIIPGFHTPAETALKRSGDGTDLFLTSCALLATGSRTALLSRWRVGGQSSRDLVREFSQELSGMSASGSWQRSVQLLRQAPVNVAHEPRGKHVPQESTVTAQHPFFWAGYMLVDTGSEPSE